MNLTGAGSFLWNILTYYPQLEDLIMTDKTMTFEEVDL